jgi:nucleotide-binding universal stress UspA family protein
MSYKNLLVHLDGRKSCEGRVAAAILLAQAHSAHLTGLYVAADLASPSNFNVEVPPEFLHILGEHQVAAMDAAKRRFESMVRKAGLSVDCRTVHSSAGQIAGIVTRHARYADLVVLGQPEADARGEYETGNAEDVVMASGRPALIVPYIGARKTIGRRPMIAWDGGREAARAVNDAMPILEKAESVSVIAINPKDGNHGQEPGADIALHLARHGMKVEVQHLEVHDMTVADMILSRMADQDIDLLVMGAYGHSRVREWILGGTTRQIFAQMTVPVLMSH